ncbi:hypothetical protein VTL71DRAFT_10874 [Oculimacula yallundae]|uniref:NACHT domain-containing protein n=1 Tax=Oculimacula yallundae TaxID=86028 RepID=A0ABR4CU84_9HELO
MAEAAIGIISLGIQVCQGLLKYYDSCKDSRKDVAAMCASVESLSNTLATLEKVIIGNSESARNAQQSIVACRLSIELLSKKLSKVQMVPEPDKLSARIHSHGRLLAYPFRESTLVKLKEILSDIRSNLSLAVDATQVHMTAGLSENVSHLASHVYDRHKDLESRSIIDWLSPLNFHQTQSDTLSRQQKGTCKWVLDTPEYQAWLAGESQILWCWGQPGAGKTILASVFIDQLTVSRQPIGTALTFLYCNYKERTSQSFTALLASLVQQLVQSSISIPEDVKSLYNQCLAKKTAPTLDQLEVLFHSLVATFSRTFIVVDGLDECSEADGTRSRLGTFLNSLPSRISILCTSRRLGDIEESLKLASRLEVFASPADVEAYLKTQIADSARLNSFCIASKDLESTIIGRLVQTAKGMFLLAKLHIESLKTKTSPKQVRKALEKLPKELNDVYNETMERIKGQHEEDAKLATRILSWITHAFRPLRVDELKHAVAVMDLDEDENRLTAEDLPSEAMMVTVCGGLAVVDSEKGTFRLVHYTTEEYFDTCREEMFPDSQRWIALSCIRYLELDWGFKTFKGGLSFDCDLNEPQIHLEPEFLYYTAKYWGDHSRGSIEIQIEEEIIKYLSNTSLLSQIREASGHVQTGTCTGDGLIVAAGFGLIATVDKLLLSGIHVDARGCGHQTALTAAASRGNVDLIRFLLTRGASTEAIMKRDKKATRDPKKSPVFHETIARGMKASGLWQEKLVSAGHLSVEEHLAQMEVICILSNTGPAPLRASRNLRVLS